MSLKTRYRVDSVPVLLRPMVFFYGWVSGATFYVYFRLIHLTSKIEVIGEPKARNYIYCIWHQNFMGYFSLFRDHSRHAWLNHPFWYMIHIWRFNEMNGVKKQIAGSTGNNGRQAADQLVIYLKEGYSTVISPDGPDGPPKILKSGIVHVALQSDVPVVPIRFEFTRALTFKGWDKKQFPLPGGTIRASFGQPVELSADNIEQARELICSGMG